MLRKQRVVTAAIITAFWLVMVVVFVHHEGWLDSRPQAGPQSPRQSLQMQDQWMGIYVNKDQRVGHLHLRSVPAARDGADGFDTSLEVRLETSLFGIATEMDIAGSAWTSLGGDRSTFDFVMTSGEYHLSITGQLADKNLHATMNTGGVEVPLDFPVNSGLFPAGGMGMPASGLPDLAPGESLTIQAFDPMTMKLGDAEVKCIGTERIAVGEQTYETRIYTTTIGTMSSKAWVADDEEVIQASTPFGFTLRKIEPEALQMDLASGPQADVIDALKVKLSGAPVVIDAIRMRVRIKGVPPDQIPNDPPWQVRTEDILDISQPTPPTGSGAPLADPAPFLESDAFVAAGDPAVINTAREIVGDETDPWKQSRLLYTWLFEQIEKTPVLGIPAALEVLRTGQGDCNEHTVLFAGFARSLGIPCRIAIGLVYSDTLGGFGYHAWPEVYCGGWYPMDPTLGQELADATHVKLFNGNLETWVQLAGFIGQIELEVLSAE